MNLKIWFLATRPWSFIMTIISTSLGASLAFKEFNIFLFILILIGLILAHAATNMLNDYFDVKTKVDRPGAPTSRYRPHPYLFGLIERKTFLTAIIFLYLIVILIALYIYLLVNTVILFILLIGLFASIFYTLPLLPLKYKAMGEPLVFIIWGPLIVGGTYYAITKTINNYIILASFPIGILVSLVLMANNIRDIEYDSSAGIKTIPIILGRNKALKLFIILLIFSYSIVLFLSLTYSLFMILAFISIPKAISIVRIFRKTIPDNADPLVAQLTLIFGIFYILGVIINNLVF